MVGEEHILLWLRNPLPLETLVQLAWGTTKASGILKVPGDFRSSVAENHRVTC